MSKRDEVIHLVRSAIDHGNKRCAESTANRILACLAEPSDAMVEAALREWFRAGRQENREAWGFGPEMRAALVAAGRAMAKS